MNKIEKARTTINKIDKEIALLFQERMKAVEEVISYKIENNLPIFDEKREKEVIQKNSSLIQEEKYKKYYIEFIQMMMDISKNYQKDILQGQKNEEI